MSALCNCTASESRLSRGQAHVRREQTGEAPAESAGQAASPEWAVEGISFQKGTY